jgi:hypothetical protein
MCLRVQNTICAFALVFFFVVRVPCASALSPPSVALGPLISTTGIGVEAATPIIPRFLNVNIGLTAFGFKDVVGSDCVSINNETRFCMPFNGKVRLGAVPLYLTLYPFGGWFNVQAGVYFNNNRLSVSAQAPGPYAAFGTISGETHFYVAAPYVGIGFGQPFEGGRFTFTGSLGVMFEGPSNIHLNASNAAMLAIPGVAGRIQSEEVTINHEISFAQFFPVVSLGLLYRF